MGVAFAVQFALFAPSVMSGLFHLVYKMRGIFVPSLHQWNDGKTNSHKGEAERGRGCQKVLSLATTVAYVDN